MTCIAGVIDPATGKVWIGGDSRLMIGGQKHDSAFPKIWKRSQGDITWIIGVCGLLRFQQVAEHIVPWPMTPEPSEDAMVSQLITWASQLREKALAEGIVKVKDAVSHAESMVIIGARRRLFTIDGSFAVGEYSRPYVAIGSGAEVAHGALWALEKTRSVLTPKERICLAIGAASDFSQSVGGRIDVFDA